MLPKPDHLNGYVKQLEDYKKYIDYSLDQYDVPLTLQCKCGNKNFIVFTDDRPYVEAVCDNCKNKISVYDLSKYPAAADIDTDAPMQEFKSEMNDNIFELFIILEYSDEFEFNDIEFDRNNITACAIYGLGKTSKKIFEIINDETA